MGLRLRNLWYVYTVELSHDHESEWNANSFGKVASTREEKKKRKKKKRSNKLGRLLHNGKRVCCVRPKWNRLLYFRRMFFGSTVSRKQLQHRPFNKQPNVCVRVLLKAIFMFRCHQASQSTITYSGIAVKWLISRTHTHCVALLLHFAKFV